MTDMVFVQDGVLKGNFEDDNYDPHVEGDDGVTYLVGSGSHSMLGKLLKAGDKVKFVDVSPSYLGYNGPKYCSLLCPHCGHWW